MIYPLLVGGQAVWNPHQLSESSVSSYLVNVFSMFPNDLPPSFEKVLYFLHNSFYDIDQAINDLLPSRAKFVEIKRSKKRSGSFSGYQVDDEDYDFSQVESRSPSSRFDRSTPKTSRERRSRRPSGGNLAKNLAEFSPCDMGILDSLNHHCLVCRGSASSDPDVYSCSECSQIVHENCLESALWSPSPQDIEKAKSGSFICPKHVCKECNRLERLKTCFRCSRAFCPDHQPPAGMLPERSDLPQSTLCSDCLSVITTDSNAFSDFIHNLNRALDSPIDKLPMLGNKQIEFLDFFRIVMSLGGAQKVTKFKKWKEIARQMDIAPTITNASFSLRKFYVKMMYAAEQVFLNPSLSYTLEESEMISKVESSSESLSPNGREQDDKKRKLRDESSEEDGTVVEICMDEGSARRPQRNAKKANTRMYFEADENGLEDECAQQDLFVQ